MLPLKETHIVFYKEIPNGEILRGIVELELIPGLDLQKQLEDAVKEKYETKRTKIELIASMGEKIAITVKF